MWRQIPPSGEAPAARFGFVAMTHADVLLQFGGYDGASWLNDMHEFSFSTFAPVASVVCR